MTQRIKYHFLKNLFQLFSALADKTGGWSMFVKPKLIIGAIIVGTTFNACQTKGEKKNKPTKISVTKTKTAIVNKSKQGTITPQPEQVQRVVSCYIGFPPPVITKEMPDTVISVGNLTISTPTPPSNEEDVIYTTVQIQPTFPGGMDSLYKYLNKNLQYPCSAHEAGVEGKVIVGYVVEKNGYISDVQILRSLEQFCDDEAVKLVKNMPAWIPGKQAEKPVRVRMTLPIVFKLPENDTTH